MTAPLGASSASGRGIVVVVSRRRDLPEVPDVVTEDEFLEGGPTTGRPRATVVNLCRSLRYLSRGYYVSLLADARGQRVMPTLETLKGISDAHSLFRALQEADVPTIDPKEMTSRRATWEEPDAKRAGARGRAAPLLVREIHEGDVAVYHPAGADEVREVVACFGRTTDRDVQRVCSAAYRIFPCPLLRVRLLREEDDWRVVAMAPVALDKVGEAERALLAAEIARMRSPDWRPPAKATDKHVSVAILYDEEDRLGPSTTETVEKLERVASRKGVHMHRIGLSEIARLGDYDALFIRTLTGLNEPAFRFAARAEALGKPVIDDTQSIIRCSNKVFLHELLKREKIPVPATMVITPHSKGEEIEARLGLPFILKQPDGSFSMAVHKVSSRTDFRERSRRMFKASPLLIAQAFAPTEFDWRVTTLDGKPLFVAKYHMARGHWQIRSADARGVRYGKVEAVARDYAPREVVRLACRAARLIGNGMYGVDLKELEDGPVVIEINDNPNLDVGYDDAADGNLIYEDIVDHFVELVEEARKPPAPARAPRRDEDDPILASLRRPIGSLRRAEPRSNYRAFDVCGIELEYPIVDRDLNVVSLVEPVLSLLAGHPTSDVAMGAVGLSNEIFDHVLELKTVVPPRSLVHAEAWLSEGVRRVSALLSDHFDARLLPTGMHPWFRPERARLWTRSNTRIYATYERLFPVRTHGWANVQAMHVNLPLGRDHEAAAMMTAAALLVPYLPAIAASSPLYEGELHGAVDGRLRWIVEHQARVPESSGEIVPEYLSSLAQYRKEVLGPMYAAVDRLPDASAIRHEFLNARGAVFKFSRNSMEVRVLDMQECVKMDVAIACFVRSALKEIATRILEGEMPLPPREALVRDFRACVAAGTVARVEAPHLLREAQREDDGGIDVRRALRELLAMAREAVRADEAPYLDLVEKVVQTGSLAERIVSTLEPHVTDEEGFTDAARRVYVELSEALRENEPWSGRGFGDGGTER
jgi:glutathione synthase/RimK-type ligase-like ATP-grasp enzyme/gamma-glutamyl:cysteine ligase YbdK (ATP-grasp superfamily)